MFFRRFNLSILLPLQFLLQDVSVCHRAVGLSKGIGLILNAEHGQVLTACILQCTLAIGSHTDDGTLTDWEYLTVYLILTLALQDNVKFLVGLVSVEETAVLTRNECLERQFAACSTYGLTCEHLTLNGHSPHRQLVLNDFIYLTYAYCAKVLACCNCLNLFNNSYSFKLLLFVLDFDRKGTAKFSSVQEGTFWCHSYQKVGIAEPSAFRNSYFNLD